MKSIRSKLITDPPNFWIVSDVCSWDGIICNNGCVEVVDVTYANSVTGALKDLLPLNQLPMLQQITLDNSNIVGSLQDIDGWSSMPSIIGISMEGYKKITGTVRLLLFILLSAFYITNLYYSFFFVSTKKLPVSWAMLNRTLNSIDFLGGNITGTLPNEYSALTLMKAITLSENFDLSGTLPPSWSTMVNIYSLAISGTSIGGVLPDSWSSWTSVQYINLGFNYLEGPLPGLFYFFLCFINILHYFFFIFHKDSWSNMTSLVELRINDNWLSSTLPASWTALTSLKFLVANDNRFSGILQPWEGMSSIYWLWLFNNRLEGTLPIEWSKLQTLSTIDVHSNILEGKNKIF